MQDIAPIYKWIVDNTIAKARASFLQDGVDEAVIEDLKSRWEQKLQDSDLFVPVEGEVEAASGDIAAGESGEAEQEEETEEGVPEGGGEAGPSQKRSAASSASSSAPARKASRPASAGSSEAPGSASDLAADEESDVELVDMRDEEISNVVLAQFEKVSRVRSKWKIQLRHGIVHLDGHEYVFQKANCEFIF